MKLVPFLSTEITTKLSKAEVMDRLSTEIHDKNEHFSGKTYVGKIEANSFEFKNITFPRIGLPALTSGYFSAVKDRTDIILNIKPHKSYFLFFSACWILCLFAVYFGMASFYQFGLLFPIGIYVMILFKFNHQSKTILAHLNRLLEGEIVN